MVYYLQLTKSVSFYQIKYPANAQIYLLELSNLVQGENLKPDNLIALFGGDFTIADPIEGAKDSLLMSEKRETTKKVVTDKTCGEFEKELPSNIEDSGTKSTNSTVLM